MQKIALVLSVVFSTAFAAVPKRFTPYSFHICAAALQAEAMAGPRTLQAIQAGTRLATIELNNMIASADGFGYGNSKPQRSHSQNVIASLDDARFDRKLEDKVAERLFDILREYQKGASTATLSGRSGNEPVWTGQIFTGEQRDAFVANFSHGTRLAYDAYSDLVVYTGTAITGLMISLAPGMGSMGYPYAAMAAAGIYLASTVDSPWNIVRHLQYRVPQWQQSIEGLADDQGLGQVISLTIPISSEIERSLRASRFDDLKDVLSELGRWQFRRKLEGGKNIWSDLGHRMSQDPIHYPVWLRIDIVRWNKSANYDQPLFVFTRTTRERPVAWSAQKIKLPTSLLAPSLTPTGH